MELHHRLRRDPSWHPSSCNICGQMGHQAANCTTGTINWRALYGDDAFRIKKPIFQSEIDAKKKAKQINYTELERQAKEYAQMREAQGGKCHEDVAPAQQPAAAAQPLATDEPMAIDAAGAAPAAAAAAAPAAAPPAAVKPEEEGLPEGWAVAYDAQKRPYYWHTRTKKTVWEKPTAETPVE